MIPDSSEQITTGHPGMFQHRITEHEARPLSAAQKLGVIRRLTELGATDLIPMLTGETHVATR